MESVVSFPRTPPASTEAEATTLLGSLVAAVSSSSSSDTVTVLLGISGVVASAAAPDTVDAVSSASGEESVLRVVDRSEGERDVPSVRSVVSGVVRSVLDQGPVDESKLVVPSELAVQS